MATKMSGYARRVLNQQDRPLHLPSTVNDRQNYRHSTVEPEFVYQEPFTSNEVRGVCIRLDRQLTKHENHRRVRYDNGRRIEVPLSHEQLRLLSGPGVPGRTRRPKVP